MDATTAEWLLGPEGQQALGVASAEADPGSVGAAERLRRHWAPEQAAAALGLVALRRRGAAKLGALADELYLTPVGLEQATRPAVSQWRASELAAAGVTSVLDLGCGLGLDALAMRRAGLTVRGVEIDEVTALFAQANTGMEVRVGSAEELAPTLLGPGEAVFVDPARRGDRGRSWRLEDLRPSWDFVTGLMADDRPVVVKLGPGLAHRDLPSGVRAVWVDHGGEVVELSLWSGLWAPGRIAVVMDQGVHTLECLSSKDNVSLGSSVGPELTLSSLTLSTGWFLYEPSGAVIRAGGLGVLAAQLEARPLQEGIAYLAAARAVATPFATAFEVQEVLPWSEKALRGWVREHRVGTLEIKKRGIDIDPAVLRKRLKPSGPNRATVVLTPTAAGAKALIVQRVAP
ncbi:MAG TPA: class I SAM-dependent methyltransferase [Propionibacteriaceae bacterium]|nr:class I SAM-dependent methyltransferase [Micropruina sp.]HBX81281.1 class I SAM-dependent methyltransferase [Propionibacteriaceae bacterium]HBY21825.1 class I SAM-dependent methyltransferase [Propionibacteriaceae bacterium]